MSGTELRYAATSTNALFPKKDQGGTRPAIPLRACYAMSGTDLAYGAPTRVLCDVRYCDSVWSCAMCATNLVYGAMMCALLPWVSCYRPTRLLRDVRY
eukprot:524591-Rhodomonas_salina.2